ncbi:MAG: HPr family phosphocarrier protein [Vicinamibacterales bacterium]
MQTAELIVRAKVGLHARPAASFVKTAASFKCNVNACNVTAPRGPVNAKSLLGVLTLGVEQNHTVEVIAEGLDEAEAIAALRSLVESNFGEGE